MGTETFPNSAFEGMLDLPYLMPEDEPNESLKDKRTDSFDLNPSPALATETAVATPVGTGKKQAASTMPLDSMNMEKLPDPEQVNRRDCDTTNGQRLGLIVPHSGSSKRTPTTSASLDDPPSSSTPFSSIFKAMRTSGFSTFDQMATAYYTGRFERSSATHEMQRRSRTRHLRALLSAIKTKSKSWPPREQRAWSEEVIDAAEEIHATEVRRLLIRMRDDETEDMISQRNNLDMQEVFFQEHLPDLWTLLNLVATTSGLEQPHASRVVLSAMHLLLGYAPVNEHICLD
jgi:hypothetical protein